jgi:archaeal flagellin FlaB
MLRSIKQGIKRIKEEQGITGLETAIVLIAFIIVASVLAYVVISAGLYSAQKAKSAVHAGLEQSGSTIELKGNVIIEMNTETNTAVSLLIPIGLVSGGTQLDLTDTVPDAEGKKNNKVSISYVDSVNQIPSLDWTVNFINSHGSDFQLDPEELAQITVDLTKWVDAEGNENSIEIGPDTSFSSEVKPPDGAVLPIERTIPIRVSKWVNLR